MPRWMGPRGEGLRDHGNECMVAGPPSSLFRRTGGAL